MKKRIAIWIHGGIGGGSFSQGQPVISKAVTHFSLQYEVIVYSLFSPNEDYRPKDFTMCFAPNWIKLHWLRWIYLVAMFIKNHIGKSHQLNYAFWGYPAGFIAVFLGKVFSRPSIIHLQGGDSVSMPEFRYGPFFRPTSRRLCTAAYMDASLVIALTHFQKQVLNVNGIARDVEVIPFGPDLKLFKMKQPTLSNKQWRFIHIGNHNPIKDQITLLKTFSLINKKVPNSHLQVIGFDALGGALKKFADKLGLAGCVEFCDPIPYHKIPGALMKADVLVLTSLFEGQATVVSEAAASGLLIAGTRVGLLSDLGDDYGVVVDVGDAESLANKILEVMDNQPRFVKYLEKSRDWCEKHDEQWTVNMILAHMHRLICE